jgi:hypothetical protein
MGTDPAIHRSTVRSEGLLAEVRREEGSIQRNNECVDDEPLLMLLEDVVEQGFVDCLQLARWARMGGRLLALKELVLGIHFPNLLLLSPRKI